jgi:hypothetical protein
MTGMSGAAGIVVGLFVAHRFLIELTRFSRDPLIMASSTAVTLPTS